MQVIEDNGTSAAQTGLSPSVEPVPVSPPDGASIPSAGTDILSEMWKAEQEAFQEMMGLPGWRYHDLPKLTCADFDRFVEIVGEDNLQWITLAEYGPYKDRPALRRGQVMMSPEAVRRAEAYASGIAARSDETPQEVRPEGPEPGGEAETPKPQAQPPEHG